MAPWPAVRELGLALQRVMGWHHGRHKESVSLTCGSEIGSQRANDVGAAWVGFNGDKVLSWWCFGSMGVHQSFLELASNFSSDQLLQMAMKNLNLVAS
jgi:hypothetical protein